MDGDNDETVSGQVLAQRLGLTPTTISKLGGDGVLVRVGRGRYALWPSIRGYLKHVSAAASGRESASARERTRLLRLRADRAQFELERERGSFLPAAEVERGLGAVAAYLRRTMLAIPSRIAGVDRRTMAEVDR